MTSVLGKGGISAKVICDSISEEGKRITTFELEYPRFILAQLNTHRIISKNSASSRAIPVDKVIEQVMVRPTMPIHWGKNQAGMQANEECNNRLNLGDVDEPFYCTKEWAWKRARQEVCFYAEAFSKAGYHKQIVNRLLEPFQFTKTVATATEWDNFFWLRLDKDAQPEIRELADCMYNAYMQSEPVLLMQGEWHLPYIHTEFTEYSSNPEQRDISYFLLDEQDYSLSNTLTLEEAKAISVSCCAQVSYRKLDTSKDKALEIYGKLISGSKVHASPFENQATPMDLSGMPFEDWMYWLTETKGITAYHKQLGFMSGNFSGWIQHRQLLDNHTCWEYKGETDV